MWKPMGEGFSINLERMGVALEKFRYNLFESGFGGWLADAFGRLANATEQLSKADPMVLSAIGAGLAAVVAAPMAGAAIWGIATSLGALGTVLASPALAALVAGGGLVALFGDIGALFQSGMKITDSGAWVNTASPIMEVVNSFKSLGGEVFGAFGDLFSSFSELAKGVLSLVGINVEGSLLASGLRGLAAIINGIAESIKFVRSALGGELFPGSSSPTQSPFNGRAFTPRGSPTAGREFNFLGNGAPGGPVQVQGQAEVTSKVDVHVTLDPDLRAQISKAAAARTTVPLNTGVSMPDAAPSATGQ
jgi:hypothetical protein